MIINIHCTYCMENSTKSEKSTASKNKQMKIMRVLYIVLPFFVGPHLLSSACSYDKIYYNMYKMIHIHKIITGQSATKQDCPGCVHNILNQLSVASYIFLLWSLTSDWVCRSILGDGEQILRPTVRVATCKLQAIIRHYHDINNRNHAIRMLFNGIASVQLTWLKKASRVLELKQMCVAEVE